MRGERIMAAVLKIRRGTGLRPDGPRRASKVKRECNLLMLRRAKPVSKHANDGQRQAQGHAFQQETA